MRIAKCIYNGNGWFDLTINKEYEILGTTTLLGLDAYIVINDRGLKQCYYTSRFKIETK